MTTQAIAFHRTSVGKKVLMAVSGLVVVGWLLLHMLGNVAVFAGRESYNAYAAFLADRPPLLWGQRLVLLAALSVHVACALSLWSQNSRARPRSYYQRRDQATNYAALTMRYGGILLLLYVVYHLLHLTVGMTGHLGYEFVPGDVYNNMVLGFTHPLVAGVYLLAQLALGMHLYHGIWSLTQTLGAQHPKYDKYRQLASVGLTVLLVLGFVSIPIAVQAGVLEPVPTAENP